MMAERALTSSPREAADSPAGSSVSMAGRVDREQHGPVARQQADAPRAGGTGRGRGGLGHARQQVLAVGQTFDGRPGGQALHEVVPAGPAADDAVGRQHRRRLIQRVDEHEQEVLRRAGLSCGGRLGRSPPGIAIGQRRLIAVVAVRDGQRRGGQGLQDGGRLGVGADPELMADTIGRARPGVGRSLREMGQGGSRRAQGPIRPGGRRGWCWRGSPRGGAGDPAWARPACVRGAARRRPGRRPPGAAGPARRWRCGVGRRHRPRTCGARSPSGSASRTSTPSRCQALSVPAAAR